MADKDGVRLYRLFAKKGSGRNSLLTINCFVDIINVLVSVRLVPVSTAVVS